MTTLSSANSAVHGPDGFTVFKMEPAELEELRACIREQWLYRLQLVAPREVHQFAAISMGQYHTLAHLVDHPKIWFKTSRVLPQRGADIIRRMKFFRKLEDEYEKIMIADEEGFGWENITWRIVRPNAPDVGVVHADEWFWEVLHTPKPKGFTPIKIWGAVYCNEGRNGLKVVAGSHWETDKYRYKVLDLEGRRVPAYDGDEKALPFTIPKTNPGDAILFNHELLHVGIWNSEATTRVSIDFTILVPERFKTRIPALN